MPLTLKQLSILQDNILYYKSLCSTDPYAEDFRTLVSIHKNIQTLIRKRSLVCSEEERSSHRQVIFDASIAPL